LVQVFDTSRKSTTTPFGVYYIMVRAILLLCVLSTSSGLKIQQNAEAEGCAIECKCKKSQWAFLWSKQGAQRMKIKQIDEAKAEVAALQREMNDLNAPAPLPTSEKGGLFSNIFGAAGVGAPKKKTAEQLTVEIERQQKKVQELEQAQAADVARAGSGDELSEELCCTNDANAERDCAGEDVPGVKAWNDEQDTIEAEKRKQEEADAQAAKTISEFGYGPSRPSLGDEEERRQKDLQEKELAVQDAAMKKEVAKAAEEELKKQLEALKAAR